MRSQINEFCARIGLDAMLTQGAGGNVSWKEGQTLWVKASGTWLREALHQDIFVPVDLLVLQGALSSGAFEAVPHSLGRGGLRPSIETVLHALMPQRVVVHLHAIEVLARLVRENGIDEMASALDGLPCSWVGVPYRKPGAPLAQAVAQALQVRPSAQVVFLANHGVVVAADTLEEVEALLATLTERLAGSVLNPLAPVSWPGEISAAGEQCLHPLPLAELQSLATDPRLLDRVRHDWALYPDHVVFLGARAHVCADLASALTLVGESGVPIDQPLFIEGLGVFSLAPLSEAKLAQLQCYLLVVLRQAEDSKLRSLGAGDVADLLGWDAEAYRQRLNQ